MNRSMALAQALEAAAQVEKLAAATERAAHGGGGRALELAAAGTTWADTARVYTALAALLPADDDSTEQVS
ncbi:hypothetical protein [Streptomyces sp. NPDC048188]|uniref:hypothetical protein n=1 Tax=Streptomyces sp. NPDC048188 TaxID=3155749 RepID=UPI00341674CE